MTEGEMGDIHDPPNQDSPGKNPVSLKGPTYIEELKLNVVGECSHQFQNFNSPYWYYHGLFII